uniref:serine hydrolase domain-containing protein n=1 Tax=Altererythrobacter segetis TaxID=1104773 RepID=UPI00243458D6|nr:serine hydrolase [Altererythrobacter segetis]
MLRQSQTVRSLGASDAADGWAQAFFDRHDAPAMAFAVAQGEGLAWSAATGMANLEFAVPATPAHLFRLGSVSKVVTTVAAARLVTRGLLELDTAIAYWLPDLPEHHRRTTLRQLFTHTGGVRHYGPQDLDPSSPGGSVVQRHYPDCASILALFIDDPLVAEPGTTVNYSSYGYTLASMVMEAAAGQDFLAIVADEIAVPFELPSLCADEVMKIIPGRVGGYFTARELEILATRMPGLSPPAGEDGFANMGLSNPSFCWAGAGLLMTMPDLARFGAALLESPKSRITADERTLLFTPLTEGSPEQPPLALGWRVDSDKRGRARWHHAGTTPGGRCGLVVYPEEDLSIALASNTMMTPGDVLGAASELAELFA